MTNVGNVTVTVSLGLERLKSDAAKAQADLAKAIQDVTVQVNVDGESIDKAADEIQGLKNTAKGDIPVRFTIDANGKLRDAQGRFVKFKEGAEGGVEVPFKFNVGNGADISDLARNLNLTFKEAKNFSNGLQLSADTANRAIGQIKNLNSVNASTVEKFRVLRKELGITKEQYLALEDAIAQTNQRLKGFDGLVQNARDFTEAVSQASLYVQALRDVSQILGQASQQFNQFNQQALGAATAFDAAQGKVGTLTQDVDGLTSSLQQLSKDLEFQTNTTDLLNASYDVLSSGYTETADVTKILAASVKGAQGGFTDVATVSDATTTILRAFKLEVEDVDHIVNVLAATQDRGKITIGEYASQIGQAASLAAQAGVSFEEFSAAVSTATAAGVPVSSSISGTRQAIVNLLKPTDQAQELLEKFGIANSAAALNSVGLIGVLEQLRDQGATTEQLSKIFSDVDAFSTVATLAGENVETFKDNLDAMENSAGKADAAAAKVAATFENQMAKAFNLANESLVELGKGVKTAITPLIQSIVFLLENFLKLPDPIQQAVGILAAFTGGTLALASAMASVAAVVGFATTLMGANTVATTANTAATTANSGATVALAGAKNLYAFATGKATLATIASTSALAKATVVVGTLAAALAVLAVAVKAAQWLDYVGDVKETNMQLEELERTANAAADGALNAVGRTKKAAADAAAAGGNLSTEQLDAAKRLAAANDLRIAQADEELAKLQALRDEAAAAPQSDATEAQVAALDALIASTTRSRDVLAGTNDQLKQNAGITEDATSATSANVEAVDEQVSALDRLKNASDAAEAAVTKSQTDQIAAIKQLQASQAISEEEAQKRIAKVEQDILNQRLGNIANQLAEVQRLRQAGAITEEEAIAEISALEQERSQLNLEAVETEIAAQERLREAAEEAAEAAKQAALDALDQQSSDVQTTADVQTGTLDIQSGALSSESALLTAKNDLLTAESELRQENLNKALEQAEAEDNTNQVIELRRQLAQEQQGLLAAQNDIAQRQLDITQEQRRLDLERREIAAETAVIEAEIALERARVEGASAAEIENRTKLLDLAKRQLAALGNEKSANQELESLEDRALEANQKLEASKVSQADAKEREVDAEERLKELRDEQRQVEADTQNTQNQAAVDAAQAEYEANPSARNLEKVQSAREKALEDEFANRQAELDAESSRRIAAAEEEAKAAAEAYNTALGEFQAGEAAALEDGTVSAEEQERLDLLQEQNDAAKESVDAANQQLGLEKQIADAKQQQLDTDKKAAQEAEKAKQKKEEEEARAAGLLSGVQGEDVNTLTAARNQLRQITEQTSKFGPGRQIQELLKFARQDSRFAGNAGQFNDVLLNQLGGLGQAALNLEAIAKSGQVGLANDLAKQLDAAQASGDQNFFQQLFAKIEELANKPVINGGVTVAAQDPIGAAGQVVRNIRAGDSKARGL